jgi:hypothetical protein
MFGVARWRPADLQADDAPRGLGPPMVMTAVVWNSQNKGLIVSGIGQTIPAKGASNS